MDIIITAIVILLGILLLAGIYGSKSMKDSLNKREILKAKFIDHYPKIKGSTDGELRDLVVKMDKNLGDILQFKFTNTLTVGENLKKLKGKISRSTLNKVWDYHKMRNSVVHESKIVTHEDLFEMYNNYLELINSLL